MTVAAGTPSEGGREIGPYQLVQCIGQGGMGEVWLAEQKRPVRRRVALKLIKTGMNTREIVTRFESERQALALLDHPAIAKVFDAGSTAEGLPYFAMEYVAGVSITEYCDRHRLGMQERLRIFIQVCEGVQHAHQKAIIHRDLKPSNILVTEVDGKPAPKIIDFGVAKATSQRLTAETMFTRVGALIGTPEYMSPEQADSGGEDIDTRSDVYSLGVVFYELLVGTLPLDFTAIKNLAFHEVLRRIREDDAPRPSTKLRTSAEQSSVTARNRSMDPADLGKVLKGDLDSIALRALEKERRRRYDSPSELAADIARYLRHEPVKAVAPSLLYRGRKFVRRHRLGVAAWGIVALAMVALAIALVVGSVRVARERDRANREAAAAEQVSSFLVKAFQVSDPNEARGNKITAREVLDNGARRVETELINQPVLQARLMFTIADVYEGLALYEPAQRLLEKAIPLQRKFVGPDARDTLASQRLLARVLEYQAQYGQAEVLYRDTLRAQEHVSGTNDLDTLRTRSSLGMLYAEEGKYQDAERLLRQTVTDTTRVSGRDSAETLNALHNLAIAYDGEHDYAKEAALWEELYTLRSRKLGTDHPDSINTLQNLAYVYYRQHRLPEAEQLQRQGLAAGERVFGKDHPNVLLALGNLANTLLDEGKASEAERLQREALEGRRRAMGASHPQTFFAMGNLANVLLAEKQYREAESLSRESLQGQIRVLGDTHPEVANAWYNLATIEAAQGKTADALADLQKALAHGYSDPDEIGGDAAWNAMRQDPGYQKAVALMKNRVTRK